MLRISKKNMCRMNSILYFFESERVYEITCLHRCAQYCADNSKALKRITSVACVVTSLSSNKEARTSTFVNLRVCEVILLVFLVNVLAEIDCVMCQQNVYFLFFTINLICTSFNCIRSLQYSTMHYRWKGFYYGFFYPFSILRIYHKAYICYQTS